MVHQILHTEPNPNKKMMKIARTMMMIVMVMKALSQVDPWVKNFQGYNKERELKRKGGDPS